MNKRTVHFLGPLLVGWETGEPPRFRSQRTQALLGYLVAERRPVARDALATFLWPDQTLSKGKGNLRRELYNLRKILPGCWQKGRKTVQFSPCAGIWVDIHELLQLVQEEQWIEAAELVRGEFLEGVHLDDNLEFETWLLGERERWRQRSKRALTQATQIEKAQGNDPQARRYLRRLLQLVPWHEEGHREMMHLLARSGQFSAALKQYEQCRVLLANELDVEPSAETTILYERIKTAMALPPYNLPPQATPFIDRDEEIAALIRRLADPECRLLTLTGVGGSGKSRLALEVARRSGAGEFRLFLHGAAFVPLVGVDSQDLVSAIGAGLGMAFSGQEPAEQQLLDYLRDMELLLLLDNYEHLLPDTALLATILREAPEVKPLVTSRERLHLREEWLFEVDGLPYPEHEIVERETMDAMDYGALDLFTACARRVRRTFSLAAARREVAAICHLAQGMPLALELSAARLKNLTAGDVLAEMERGLDILATETQNIPSRHTSLRAAFDVSWARLSAQERKVLSQLSLFRGGFTRAAASEVARATRPVLRSLSDKSLIRLMPSGRYEMHELLRQYAAEKLAGSPELNAACREEYVAYYGAFLQQREQRLLETDQAAALREIDPEVDNLRHAWRWAVERDQLEFLYWGLWTMGFFYELRGWFPEALELIENTLQRLSWLRVTDPHQFRVLARLRLFQGYFLQRRGRPEESRNVLVLVRSWLRDIGDERDLAWACLFLGRARLDLDDLDGCLRDLEEGAAICRRAQLQWLEAVLAATTAIHLATTADKDRQVLDNIGQLSNRALALSRQLDIPWVHNVVNFSCARLAMYQGAYRSAELMDQRALEAARQIEYTWGIGIALFYLGLDKYLQEDAEASWRTYEESQPFTRRSGDRHLQTILVSAMGELARFQGDYDRASRLYRQGIKNCTAFGFSNLAATLYCMYGHALLRQTKWSDAGSYFLQSLSSPGSRTSPVGDMTGLNLAGLAGVLAGWQKPGAAAQLMGAAEAQNKASFRQLWPGDLKAWDQIVVDTKEQLDEETFATAWEAGRALSVEDAVRLALENGIQSP